MWPVWSGDSAMSETFLTRLEFHVAESAGELKTSVGVSLSWIFCACSAAETGASVAREVRVASKAVWMDGWPI